MLLERFIFSTSTVLVKLEPEFLRANPSSELVITAIPLNKFGFRNILGSTSVAFNIQEGTNLVEVIPSTEKDRAIVRSKGKEGEAVIGVYSTKSGLILQQVVIRILPRDYASAF